jgi:hypothetical protein
MGKTKADATALGQTGLAGWREKVASGIAPPISARTRLGDDEVRALVGALFFALSVYYVIGTVRRALAEARR